MLDEIKVTKTSSLPNIYSAHPTVIEALPFLESRISFRPFINYLKQKLDNVSDTKELLYHYLIKKFEAHPELLQPIQQEEMLGHHEELMDLLTTSLFPVICHDQGSFALAAPYQFKVFYSSEPFKKLFYDNKSRLLHLPRDMDTEELKTIQCAAIYDQVLEQFYNMQLNEDRQLIYPIEDETTGMTRYYRIRYDSRFTELQLKGKLPPIQDCAVCMNTFRILDLEKQLATMPLHLFAVEGFALWVAEDVTTSESLDIIKKILLREDCNTDVIEELKTAVKALVALNDIDVGLMPFVSINGQEVLDEFTGKHSLVCRQWLDGSNESLQQYRSFVEFLRSQPEPMPVSNVTEEMLQMAPFLRQLYDKGLRSFICYPMQNSDGLIGFLEISSPVQNKLTQETIRMLEPAIPLLSLALLKCRDNFQNRIEKLIRDKFTALQQSVEWKFAEVAWEHLRVRDSSMPDRTVMFEDVYPLYGAIDIRNSSLERSNAIQKDWKEHLSLVAGILQELQTIVQLPLLEGLEFRNQNIRQSLEENMTAEEEISINDFISNEVVPLLLNLQKTNPSAQEIIEKYLHMLQQAESPLNRYRCEYETSVAAINETILTYLEKEQELIQQSYPHYYEKFRSDGIEYNIYIGQSIAPALPFDLFYLKNIRLWQLKSMAGIARLTANLLPQLKLPLQTTQLILVHGQPIAISFRRDERKFDVEGSYNIRYEIMKKRLDKVHVKDSGERLTQPGKIAIVYSNQKDVTEYEEFILFLQKKNILHEGIEMLELEELQGIKGLRAMRVAIKFIDHSS